MNELQLQKQNQRLKEKLRLMKIHQRNLEKIINDITNSRSFRIYQVIRHPLSFSKRLKARANFKVHEFIKQHQKIKPPINVKVNTKIKNKDFILIINGAKGSVSEIHRVYHLAETFSKAKISYVIYYDFQKRFWLKALKSKHCHSIYIHRAVYSNLSDLFRYANRHNKKIFFDIDDLVFNPQKIKLIPFIRKWDKSYRDIFLKTAKEYLKSMSKSNVIVVTNKYLSDEVKELFPKKQVLILTNHLDENTFNLGQTIYNKKIKLLNKTQNKIILGYFSGTKTHDEDFEVIKQPLIKILKIYDNVYLKIVGALELSSKFDKFKDRIIKIPLRPYKEFIREYEDVDIDLIPLVMDNDFNKAKSNLKYFFAGICGVPSIASNLPVYVNSIKQGYDGYLCANEKEWFSSMSKLIEIYQQKKQKTIMNRVHQKCLKYGPDNYVDFVKDYIWRSKNIKTD